jgi:hypothetical protein
MQQSFTSAVTAAARVAPARAPAIVAGAGAHAAATAGFHRAFLAGTVFAAAAALISLGTADTHEAPHGTRRPCPDLRGRSRARTGRGTPQPRSESKPTPPNARRKESTWQPTALGGAYC